METYGTYETYCKFNYQPHTDKSNQNTPKVLNILNKKLPGLYDMDNLMLSSTHTHSTPGGYMMHMLFDLSTLGFVQQTQDCLVKGITLVSL